MVCLQEILERIIRLDMLKYKAKYLVENEDICYITIDKVEEVIKDTRLEVVEKSVKSKF